MRGTTWCEHFFQCGMAFLMGKKHTPLKTNMSPEKIDGWKMYSLLKWSLFRGHSLVSGRVNYDYTPFRTKHETGSLVDEDIPYITRVIFTNDHQKAPRMKKCSKPLKTAVFFFLCTWKRCSLPNIATRRESCNSLEETQTYDSMMYLDSRTEMQNHSYKHVLPLARIRPTSAHGRTPKALVGLHVYKLAFSVEVRGWNEHQAVGRGNEFHQKFHCRIEIIYCYIVS